MFQRYPYLLECLKTVAKIRIISGLCKSFPKYFYTACNQPINKQKGSWRDLRAVVAERGGAGRIGFEENLFFLPYQKKGVSLQFGKF